MNKSRKSEMEIRSEKSLHVVFKVICFSGVIAASIWCCYQFSKNEDSSELLFKTFLEDEDSVYPDLTIGIPHQLNDTAVRKILGNDIDVSMYRRYLGGSFWDDRLPNIKVEDISVKLEESLIWKCVVNLERTANAGCLNFETIITKYFFGLEVHTFRFPPKKCFVIHIKFAGVSVTLVFDKIITIA